MYFTSLYGPVPICWDVFGMSLSGAYVSLGTILQHCVARIEGHVDCGDLRLKVTAYLPFVLTLFKLPMSGEGELAAACLRIDLFVTRSMENFTSAESNELPSWNVTPLRRLQRHVFVLPTGKHLVASSGWSLGPFV